MILGCFKNRPTPKRLTNRHLPKRRMKRRLTKRRQADRQPSGRARHFGRARPLGLVRRQGRVQQVGCARQLGQWKTPQTEFLSLGLYNKKYHNKLALKNADS